MRSLARALTAVAAGLLVAACTTPGGREVAVVEITGAGFEPATLVVAPGTEVRWTNETPGAHTVTSGGDLLPDDTSVPPGAEDFDSGRLLEGEGFTQVFEVEGTYFYGSQYEGDQQMAGTILVEEP